MPDLASVVSQSSMHRWNILCSFLFVILDELCFTPRHKVIKPILINERDFRICTVVFFCSVWEIGVKDFPS